MKIRNLIILLIVFTFNSCEPEITEFQPDSGNADFSVFIALGSSETAGFANNELYKSAQMVSFANIVSRQLLHVGGGEFKQPLMADELGFGNKLTLSYNTDCLGDSTLLVVPAGGVPDESNTENIYVEEGPFHNLGIPGTKIYHLPAPMNTLDNPIYSYFSRFASSPATSIMLDAMSLNASFFSLWVGTSDVLDYAMSGGVNGSVIETEEFNTLYNSVLMDLTSRNAEGVIANIPNILTSPFFSHLSPAGIWVQDSLVPSGKRLLDSGEIVLLSAEEKIKCEGWGTKEAPLSENLYLSDHQILLIQNKIQQFNTIIGQAASEFDLALADMYLLFDQLSEGRTYDGLCFNNKFISGGLFSLDGTTLTAQGNAIVANTFIAAINQQYKSTIPQVSITEFQGIEYP